MRVRRGDDSLLRGGTTFPSTLQAPCAKKVRESNLRPSLRYYPGGLKFNLTIPNDRQRHTQRNGGYRA